jgi:hypothetical protein
VERKDKGRKDLTAPLTFILSRKGREELKGCPLTLPSPTAGRGKMKRKEFNNTTHFYSLPQGERRDEIKDFRENPSPYPLPRGGEGER